ncbi:hypothetical protein EIB18_15275 [Caulobacter vibrioides]|uniref:hypothetical protein n=1 Tax=Caulobacter vibrioides TaxID=155892 RepID=UPI000F5C9185|nr:hypothetical protein [Caulobacter vibrioides]AZH13925.1 hypothetical protein EIB18_15275 [Caulobacter vibrioides]
MLETSSGATPSNRASRNENRVGTPPWRALLKTTSTRIPRAYADYLDRICDEAERTGGVPFEVFRERLRNLGQRR